VPFWWNSVISVDSSPIPAESIHIPVDSSAIPPDSSHSCRNLWGTEKYMHITGVVIGIRSYIINSDPQGQLGGILF